MNYPPDHPMEYPEWMIKFSLWLAWRIHKRRGISLCAVAQERSKAKGYRIFSHRFFDWMFFFDPDHCYQSYLWYKLEELNRELKEEQRKCQVQT